MTSSRISVRQLERSFEAKDRIVHALGPTSFEVPEGQFLCIVGPSGCGKSTLLRVMAGLVAPSSGEVEIFHQDPTRPLVGMVFQDHSVYPWKTVEENVSFGLDVLGDRYTKSQREAIVATQLRRLGLADFAKAWPDTLSGGMRQRVAIARALAIEPELLLMDEPFASLDAQMRTLQQDSLVAIWEEDRRTAVFITHSIDEAMFLGDRVIAMSARPGQIRADIPIPWGRPREHSIRSTLEFATLQEEIWNVLRTEVEHDLSRASNGHRAS